MGGTGVERYHDCANFSSCPEAFPRSKDISAARSVPLPFFPPPGDQRGRSHQSKRGLVPGHRRKMEITQITKNKGHCSNCVPARSRKRIRSDLSNTDRSCCCHYSGESSFSGSAESQRSTSQTRIQTDGASRGSTRQY